MSPNKPLIVWRDEVSFWYRDCYMACCSREQAERLALKLLMHNAGDIILEVES